MYFSKYGEESQNSDLGFEERAELLLFFRRCAPNSDLSLDGVDPYYDIQNITRVAKCIDIFEFVFIDWDIQVYAGYHMHT